MRQTRPEMESRRLRGGETCSSKAAKSMCCAGRARRDLLMMEPSRLTDGRKRQRMIGRVCRRVVQQNADAETA